MATYKEMTGQTIRDAFLAFHKQNPHVYSSFESQAIEAINRGRTKLSAKLIINWIRWNEILKTSEENFKINDAFQSYYARLFIENHPQHEGVFELRRLRNEETVQRTLNNDGQCTFW